MTFRAGGWLILLAFAVLVGGGAWQTTQVLRARSAPKPGDGADATTYGFDLDGPDLRRDLISPTSLPRDGMKRLDEPPHMSVETWREHWSSGRHRKYLVPSDRVVGVAIGEKARAYPLRVLNWHEIANDTLSGVPFTVTYAPLADGVVVLDRRTGGGVRRYGFSGLVYNGCPLVYDTVAEPGETGLFSPLGLRAVTGPAAVRGEQLSTIPFTVTTWGTWLVMHPETRVLEPALDHLARYARDPYHNYYGNDVLETHPVDPLPPPGERRKAPVLALLAGERSRVLPFALVRRHAGADGTWTTRLGEIEVTITHRTDPEVAWVSSARPAGSTATPDVVAVPCFRWAWSALHPAAVVETTGGQGRSGPP